MLDFEENIDLDALFDSLSVVSSRNNVDSDSLKRAAESDSGVAVPEFQQMSAINVDLFLFDNPADQS